MYPRNDNTARMAPDPTVDNLRDSTGLNRTNRLSLWIRRAREPLQMVHGWLSHTAVFGLASDLYSSGSLVVFPRLLCD